MRSLLRSVIHNATVTAVDDAPPVSLRVDPYLMRAAELLPCEEVEVVNVATGERFRTWIEAAEEGSGEVRLHAGTRTPVRKGDRVSILAFGILHDGQTLDHRARVVVLDAANRVVEADERRGSITIDG
jgi:aspartate 1-decarboxylase